MIKSLASIALLLCVATAARAQGVTVAEVPNGYYCIEGADWRACPLPFGTIASPTQSMIYSNGSSSPPVPSCVEGYVLLWRFPDGWLGGVPSPVCAKEVIDAK